MKLDFYKYQGTGNDFIMINCLRQRIHLSASQIQQLCNRKTGIGSDGVIFLRPSVEHDFYMDFYNPDGSQSFCGNGARCSVAFAKHMGLIRVHASFEAIDGVHAAFIEENVVTLDMKNVQHIEQLNESDYFLDTGSPHFVHVTDEELDIVKYGRAVRYSEKYKINGVNVNTLYAFGSGFNVSTYERGVEDETLSCGTGVTACGLVAMLINESLSEVNIFTKGGRLKVVAEKDGVGFTSIKLIGPAKYVFHGSIEI